MSPAMFSTKPILEKARIILNETPGQPWYYLSLPSFLTLLNVFTNPSQAPEFSGVSIFLDDPFSNNSRNDQQTQKLTFENAKVEKVEFEPPKPSPKKLYIE